METISFRENTKGRKMRTEKKRSQHRLAGTVGYRKITSLLAALFALTLVATACSTSSNADSANDAEGSSNNAGDEGSESGDDADSSDLEFATVVKLTGISWFDRMETGVIDFGEDNDGISTFQQGPSEADAALQVQVLEDLIARDVDAISVVPFQPDTVEPVLEKARDAGIVVVSHEASSIVNVDWDVEAFDNAAYGRHLMDLLAEDMEQEGEYAVMVGSLTSESHNQWVDAAIEPEGCVSKDAFGG